MVERIHIRRNPFRFRISKPGKSVDSADLNDFIMHESLGVVAPYITGTVTVASNSNVLVNFGRTYSRPALVMLKASNGYVQDRFQYYCEIQSNLSSMRIYNLMSISLTITYFVYWNSLGGD